MAFKKAERKQSKLKIALVGPAGSGKTMSALLLAKGLGGPIAVIDTERGSASKHIGKEGIPEFDVDELTQFEPEAYIKSIKEAVANDYNVLIIDSLSHEWAATKSIAQVAGETRRNDWAGWATATPRHQALIDTILQAPIHIITTMRAKTEWAVEKDDRGKTKPVKLGLGPDQRSAIEYEFDTIFSIAENHVAVIDKDRTDVFKDFMGALSETEGKRFKQWLETGAENPNMIRATQDRKKVVFALLKDLGLDYDQPEVKERLKALTQKESMTLWSEADVNTVIKTLEDSIKQKIKRNKTTVVQATA